jgi:hypothetical protein
MLPLATSVNPLDSALLPLTLIRMAKDEKDLAFFEGLILKFQINTVVCLKCQKI